MEVLTHSGYQWHFHYLGTPTWLHVLLASGACCPRPTQPPADTRDATETCAGPYKPLLISVAWATSIGTWH